MSVVRLRELGRVLTRRELPQPVVGDLVIDDWPPQGAHGRWRRRAVLQGDLCGLVRPNLVPAMFDVQVLRIDQRGMFIQGTEIEPRHPNPPIEHVQVWLCRPSDRPYSAQPCALDPRDTS